MYSRWKYERLLMRNVLITPLPSPGGEGVGALHHLGEELGHPEDEEVLEHLGVGLLLRHAGQLPVPGRKRSGSAL